MKLLPSLRGGLLMTSAAAVLAACSGSGSISNNGDTGSVTVGGGGSTGGGATVQSFVPTGFTCPVGSALGTATVSGTQIEACLISGDIVGDTVLPGTSNGQRVGYLLQGTVFVGGNIINDAGAATADLEIGAGAIIMGAAGEDALVINPGSSLTAVGSPSEPIVMTSASDAADGSVDDGLVRGSSSAKGEWGGLVLNGLARINDCNVGTNTPGEDDCNKSGEGGSGLFGGNDDTDSSGTLSYVRVQYAGFRFNGEDELNGIAFQGVGNGTQVDHVQVHNGNDDGVEFFGGDVNAKYVVVTGADDDSIDWTDGWRGDLQYALVIQDDTSADRAIEADNRGNDVNVGEAQGIVSNPNISNFTFFGSSAAAASPSDGLKLRAGTNGNIANGIVIGFGLGDGIDFDRNNEYEDADGNVIGNEDGNATPSLNSIFVFGNARPFDTDGGTLFNAGSNNTEGAFSTMNGVIPGGAEQAVTATDISTGTTLDAGQNYIGAFDPASATNASNWTTGWTLTGTIPGATPPACPVGTSVSADTVPSGRFESLVCNIPNDIETDITLTAGNLYKFSGTVFVGDDLGPDASNPLSGASATLTIDPGVTVYGENGEDAIVVNRGSRIVAEGTENAPIVFTSESDILGSLAGTEKGEFGGLVINGRARINDCNVGVNTPGTAGCEKSGEGGSGLFGGNDDNDDSGVLSYVQVRYAGFRFNGEDELNGIAFQGVGDDTQVDHIHVHNGNDDGVEFFGGTVDAKYVIVTGADDDSIDWTDGWRGSIQYALVVQDDVSADRGIEGDNRGNDVNVGEAQEVVTTPTISNFTFFGSSAAAASPADGVKLRAGTDGYLLNGIVLGFGAGDGIDFDRNNEYEDADGNVIGNEDGNATPSLFSIYVADNNNPFDTDGGTLFNVASSGNVNGGAARNMNGFIPNATLQGLITAKDVSTITFPTYADNSADVDVTTYVGAFDPASETNADNWATGWSFNVSTSLPNVN